MDEALLLKPGEKFGDYVVEQLLGKGGMGAVYLLRAPGGEKYAAKIMFPEAASRHEFRKRFAREAEFAMGLRHENLVSVYDVGEDPETGLCYIIMEYVPGGSLADLIEKNGPLPIDRAVSIAMRIAVALEAAHSRGLVHRDVKPDNILFTKDGVPKLADLGVAKFEDRQTTVTTTGMVIGTPAYMAPEQMMDSRRVDARADIYALGVVLYEMISGKRPNEGSTAVELLAKAITGEPLPDVRTMRPDVSATVAYALSVMCAPKPEDRPATALKAAQLLRQAATGELVLPKKPPRAADAASRKGNRRLGAVICAVAAFVALAIGLGWWGLSRTREVPPPPPSPSMPAPQPPAHVVVVTNTVDSVVVVTNVVGVQVPSGASDASDGVCVTPDKKPDERAAGQNGQRQPPRPIQHTNAIQRTHARVANRPQTVKVATDNDSSLVKVETADGGTVGDAEKVRKWIAALVPILGRRMDGTLNGELRKLGVRVIVGKAKSGDSSLSNVVQLKSPCGEDELKSLVSSLIFLGADGRVPKSVDVAHSTLDGGIALCLAEEVQAELARKGILAEADETNSSALKWALGVDLRMAKYDLHGKPARRSSRRRLNGAEEQRMARAKVAWIVRELGRNHRDILAAYFRARWEAKCAGHLTDALSDDDTAVLLSIAADTELFDWFREHGIDVRPSRSRIPVPDRIKPKKPLEKPVEVQWK